MTVSLVPHNIPVVETTPQAKRIIESARQFEGVLLNSMLSSLEKAFTSLPGATEEIGAGDYHYLGMQVLSSTLAAEGGIGIADMIARRLRNVRPQ